MQALNNEDPVVTVELERRLNLRNITGNELGGRCNENERTSCSLEGPGDALLVHI